MSDRSVAETSTRQHPTRDIQAPRGIRTRNLSKREAVDPRLRRRHHWITTTQNSIEHFEKQTVTLFIKLKVRKICCPVWESYSSQFCVKSYLVYVQLHTCMWLYRQQFYRTCNYFHELLIGLIITAMLFLLLLLGIY